MGVRVEKSEEGWAVMRGDTVIEQGLTNSQAWRLADKMNGEAVNRQQVVSDWVFEQQAHREAERRRQRYAISRKQASS